MTAPVIVNENGTAEPARRRRRRIALAAVLGLIIVAALLTPEMIGGRSGDPRLTTYSASPQGARLLFELTRRLGWRVERGLEDSVLAADSRTVIAVLDPVQPLSALESHRLLERVRAGSGLLYVMSGSSPLNDSLHVKRSLFGGIYERTPAGTLDAPATPNPMDGARARRFDTAKADADSTDEEDDADAKAECGRATPNGGALPMWTDQTVRLWRLQFTRERPAGTVIFARSIEEDQPRNGATRPSSPAAAGFPFGRGRVVVLSDPDFLRNDVLRVCKWGLDVVAVRILEYLSAGSSPRDRLVFDEYHQGYGTHPGTLRAIVVFLSRSSSGHVLLQCVFAGLVLLLALGPRLLPAHDPARVERRSPLEHVSALAQAYARVKGTHIATAWLLRGVRRRVSHDAPSEARGATQARDASFLDGVEAVPILAADAALVRRALVAPVTGREFAAVGAALKRIEQSLITSRR